MGVTNAGIQFSESEEVVIEKWIKGKEIGRGSFGTVNLALALTNSHPHTPLIMAVKSSLLSHSSSLEKERQVMAQLQGCPHILRCFGHDVVAGDNGQLLYNLFLEFATGGSLAGRGRFPENKARGYTASILEGLSFLHWKGLVHCDVKLQNILLCSRKQVVKIGDFGLVKKEGEKVDQGICLRGTPVNMAPESVTRSEYEPPSDIWALGCAVVEMITGKPAWRGKANENISSLLFWIGFSNELPDVPIELSDEGKDFLRKCFVRDPAKRWTADMLLQHPFVTNELVAADGASQMANLNSSPRSIFDFMAWESLQSSLCLESVNGNEGELDPVGTSSPADRIRQLAMGKLPNWPDCEEDWITLRQAEESSVSELVKIQAHDCSVSSATEESPIELGQTVQIDGKTNTNSDFSVRQCEESLALAGLVSLERGPFMILEQGNMNSRVSKFDKVRVHSSYVSSLGQSSLIEETGIPTPAFLNLPPSQPQLPMKLSQWRSWPVSDRMNLSKYSGRGNWLFRKLRHSNVLEFENSGEDGSGSCSCYCK